MTLTMFQVFGMVLVAMMVGAVLGFVTLAMLQVGAQADDRG